MDPLPIILAVALVACVGAIAFLATRKVAAATGPQGETGLLAEKIIANAEREAEMLKKSVELEVKDQRLSLRAEVDEMNRERQEALADKERSLSRLEEDLDQRGQDMEGREEKLSAAKTAIDADAQKLIAELEKAADLSADEARAALTEQIESEARFESAKLLQRIDEETRTAADDKARQVITSAIQRLAGDYVVESTISVVSLPSDDMKGRIIGREGRNIRALEAATGVNLIVDDTPGTILLSSFDPLRREVASQTLEKLMTDGRIHPTRIEETVASIQKKLDEEMLTEANKVLFELDVHDVSEEVAGLLGRLKYRMSYGQNNLAHAREVALICGMMADELGLDRQLAVRGGLLHDIGKALTHEVEGGHATIGADFARKHGEHADVVNAIGSHHGDVPPTTREAYLVAAGDALSAGRPGARRENLEFYVQRLTDLEQVAGSFPGVDKAYAMQAGREVRVLVDADSLTDGECSTISRDIAKKIEKELTYPGQIKICLVRESRFIEYAR